jgi:hypothetical protein
MIIIVFAFKSLAEYMARSITYEVERPDSCPRRSCRRQRCFWKHTAYERHAQDGGEPVLLEIQRFRCRYCHLVISCLFSFLVAYRRHTAKIVSACIEIYATAPAVAPLESYRKLADDHGCSRMSVWRWVAFLAEKSDGLHGQVQKEFMLGGQPWQMLSSVPGKGTSPSSGRAKSAQKQECLNALFLLIEISKVFLGSVTSALEALHAHFLKNIESRQLILTGRKIAKPTQQSMGRLF